MTVTERAIKIVNILRWIFGSLGLLLLILVLFA